MNSNTADAKAPVGSQQPVLEHYPPPPPGPPPHHQQLGQTPMPDYEIPAYDPSHPQFVPPPAAASTTDSGLYDAEPIPPYHQQEHHQQEHHQQEHHQQEHHQEHHQQEHHQQQEHHVPPAKAGWGERLSALGSKAAAPFNMLANKMGSESFLPATMDKECEKAARILRAFCKDGIYTDAEHPAPPVEAQSPTDKTSKPKPKGRSILTHPVKVISRAVGLAIFTTGRVGFHVSGSTGSGILMARLPDGSWGPPSGIQVHVLGAGFVIGLDIYELRRRDKYPGGAGGLYAHAHVPRLGPRRRRRPVGCRRQSRLRGAALGQG